MNLITVGTENLPNVYIDKIYTYDFDENSNEIIVIFNMYDHRDEKSWRGVIDDLKLKTYFTTDEEEMELLNSGNKSLYEVQSESIPVVLREDIKKSVARTSFCSRFAENSIPDNNEYFLYSHRVSALVKKGVKSLNVYAACYIDDLGFGINLFDKFYGPMVGEKILVNTRISKNSGYFYNPQSNEEYGGPVHINGTNYMVGSEHTDDQHASLRYIEEDNFKIVLYAWMSPYEEESSSYEEEKSLEIGGFDRDSVVDFSNRVWLNEFYSREGVESAANVLAADAAQRDDLLERMRLYFINYYNNEERKLFVGKTEAYDRAVTAVISAYASEPISYLFGTNETIYSVVGAHTPSWARQYTNYYD